MKHAEKKELNYDFNFFDVYNSNTNIVNRSF